jgi:hypothetical protein
MFLILLSKILVNGNPDLDSSGSGLRIEVLAVGFKLRRLDESMPRFLRPFVIDSVPGFADFQDVIAMGENGVVLRRHRQMGQPRRNRQGFGHFDSAHVIEISCAIEVETDTVGLPSGLPGDLAHVQPEALPLRRNAFDAIVVITPGQTGEKDRSTIFETRVFHFSILTEKDARWEAGIVRY